ncbi:MAG: NADH-quinone oxidoreductase subunit NuoE family protein [Thermodesulfobacteriota bacterium]
MAQASSQTTGEVGGTVAPEFTADQLDAVDSIIRRNRDRPGALIPVLKDVQDVTGYLPLSLQQRIATGLKLSFSEVYGVVTFYSFFRQKPIGRHLIKVCMGTACYVRGNKDLVQQLSRDLDCGVGGTTEDRRFSIEGVRCLGCCGIAPVITVGEDVHREVRVKDMPPILEQYK